jgi:hypothetical protein
MENSNIVAIGRITPHGDGGYGASRNLLANRHRIRDDRIRKYLLLAHSQYTEKQVPVITTTQGNGGICELKSTVTYEKMGIIKKYRYPVVNDYLMPAE